MCTQDVFEYIICGHVVNGKLEACETVKVAKAANGTKNTPYCNPPTRITYKLDKKCYTCQKVEDASKPKPETDLERMAAARMRDAEEFNRAYGYYQ